MKNLEEIKWRGHIVKIPPIDLQLHVNKKRGRTKRVKAIESFLK
jgi:hypothetical protein